MATKVVNLSETNLTCFFLDVFRQHSSQSITVSVVSCVVTSLFAYTAVMVNGATMLVIWKTRELHSPSFALLFCLAFSDFLVGLLGQLNQGITERGATVVITGYIYLEEHSSAEGGGGRGGEGREYKPDHQQRSYFHLASLVSLRFRLGRGGS